MILAPGARRALNHGLPAGAAQLHAPLEGLWRARRGEYRVRYRIDDKQREAQVIDVDHRVPHTVADHQVERQRPRVSGASGQS
ncbi:type II toxin-antitoxin system RelE family toxin [Solwaraspora sp. WMMB335]|uniref:type II toxin-antitoxin system RelE family toxin n=1 Tax=Solwaraspora sp. WMMB335 TaxID=3404118 RepID=UPI003B9377BB